jgi:uncharacterized protein DUF3179
MKNRLILVFTLTIFSFLLIVPIGTAQNISDFSDYETTLQQMVLLTADVRFSNGNTEGFFTAIGENGDPLYVAPLIDVLYFMFGRTEAEIEIFRALSQLTGLPPTGSWRAYFEWGSENDIALPPKYDQFKGALLATMVDPQFDRFFDNVQDTSQINMLEIVWGGVRVDGIPSLVNARQISPADALIEGERFTQYCRDGNCIYPQADELVFGVYVDGDARAYPLRIMNWHEMFNDVLGMTPMFDAPNGEQVCNFRAPTEFTALARRTDEWVLIEGYSPACPERGWLAASALDWGESTWGEVRAELPDIAENEALNLENEVTGRVQGRAVMLAYCTLCGAGILYDVTIPDLNYTDSDGNLVEMPETILEFGSTGLLMRSNKLMYDRTTDTVWNAFTGVPAFGSLAGSDIELPLLPAVVIDWDSWLEQHPDTSVLSLQTDYNRDYSNGGAYSNYFNNPDFVMFPVFQQDESQVDNKDMIFGLRISYIPKAYPLGLLIAEPVLNDIIDDTTVVIVAEASPDRDFFEPGGAAVRAYYTEGLQFSATEIADELVDDTGQIWQMTEDALISSEGRTLDRLAGHLAFWFGWYGFYPETLIYEN